MAQKLCLTSDETRLPSRYDTEIPFVLLSFGKEKSLSGEKERKERMMMLNSVQCCSIEICVSTKAPQGDQVHVTERRGNQPHTCATLQTQLHTHEVPSLDFDVKTCLF